MNTGCRDESGSGLDELSRDEIHADQIAVGRAAESYVLSDCLLASVLPACWVILRTLAKILICYRIYCPERQAPLNLCHRQAAKVKDQIKVTTRSRSRVQKKMM